MSHITGEDERQAKGILVRLSTCVFLWSNSIQALETEVIPGVTKLSFGIIVITVFINLGVAKWEQRKGNELQSAMLSADSYHTVSDVLTSFSVIIGFIAIQPGYPIVDPLISICIAFVIAWTAVKVLKEVSGSLLDSARLRPDSVHAVVMQIHGILACHEIRTRGMSSHVFVDLSRHVAPHVFIQSAHRLTDTVTITINHHFPNIKDVVVHIEPHRQQ